ncbi:MAG: amidohydrolase [Acidimicrobiia bacterium]|nr:amidohydrolase [Acidimicrobiia bacterium]
MNRRRFLTSSAGVLASALVPPVRDGVSASAGQSRRSIVIDAHAHYGYLGGFGQQRDISFEECLEAADQAGIDKLCLCSIEALAFEMTEGNKAIHRLMKQYPDRIIGFATVPSPYFGKKGLDELQRAIEVYGMKGIGELETTPAYPIDIPHWIAVLKKAAALRVPVLVHGSPSTCARAAEQVPDVTILLAHLGTGFGLAVGEWLDTIEMAKSHPNVYLETCTSITAYGQIEMAVQELGSGRLVFGTDIPLLDPSVMKAKITGADIPSEAKENILGKNMARLLKL